MKKVVSFSVLCRLCLDLRYEIAVADNCAQDNTLMDAIFASIPVEKTMISYVHYGLPYGLNSLFFTLCTAPLIFSMEDDWIWY